MSVFFQPICFHSTEYTHSWTRGCSSLWSFWEPLYYQWWVYTDFYQQWSKILFISNPQKYTCVKSFFKFINHHCITIEYRWSVCTLQKDSSKLSIHFFIFHSAWGKPHNLPCKCLDTHRSDHEKSSDIHGMDDGPSCCSTCVDMQPFSPSLGTRTPEHTYSGAHHSNSKTLPNRNSDSLLQTLTQWIWNDQVEHKYWACTHRLWNLG